MSSANGNKSGWANVAYLLFGCRRTRKVAVHCHASSPKPTEPRSSSSGSGGTYFDPPAKKQKAEEAAALAHQHLDNMFCFTGRGAGVLSETEAETQTKFSSGDSRTNNDGASEPRAPPAGGEVVKPEAGGAAAAVDPVFCATYPSTKDDDGERGGGQERKANGGAAGRDRGESKAPPLREIHNGARSRSATVVKQQQEKQRRLQPQQSKPSYRRKSSGAAPPVSGRVAIVPRRSVDSAAKPAPSPPSRSPAVRHKQLLPQLSSSGSSFESLTSLTSDVDGGNYTNSRGTFSLASSTTRRASAGRRRRRPVILAVDMPEKLQQDALECTARAIGESSDHEDIAASIKKDFDELHGAKWHCIVGRHFGSFVTAESNHFVHLYLGKVAVLLFKAGA